MSFFFFYKIKEHEDGTGHAYGVGKSGRREEVEKGYGR
jgi:hypothetical protein